ncbi:hypothetical protein [Microvirga aerophila]|uniref:hypothetical protein n=1 Tax=Microvirga aerophila TaxID=670291 RepID=UPI0011BEEB54|nr:hypothetical protein [Microvirga aerophila]
MANEVGTIHWVLPLPGIGYETYRLNRSILSKMLVRQTLSWRLKTVLLMVCLFVLPVSMGLIYLQTYVFMYAGSARIGAAFHLGTHGFVMAGLGCFATLYGLLYAYYRAHNQRIQHVLFGMLSSEEPARELIVGDWGLLAATPTSELLTLWEKASAFRRIGSHWVLMAKPASVFCIPDSALNAYPSRDALIAFIMDKVEQSKSAAG